jgi:hypothetical protein
MHDFFGIVIIIMIELVVWSGGVPDFCQDALGRPS